MDSLNTPDGNATQDFNQHLDARGLNCPLPLLKAKQQLSRLQPGQQLTVLASDPGSWDDFASYAELSSHQLVSRQQLGDDYQFILLKGE